jgi:hypothetical protein
VGTGPSPVALPSSSGAEDDDGRSVGEAALEREVAQIAQRADSLDGEWTRFVRSCLARSPRANGERGWFAMWDRDFDAIPMNPGCANFYRDYRQAADAVRARVVEADEAARRAGVYPGTRRALRARYRLAWDE